MVAFFIWIGKRWMRQFNYSYDNRLPFRAPTAGRFAAIVGACLPAAWELLPPPGVFFTTPCTRLPFPGG